MLLQDARFADNAKTFQEAIASVDGVSTAATIIEAALQLQAIEAEMGKGVDAAKQ